MGRRGRRIAATVLGTIAAMAAAMALAVSPASAATFSVTEFGGSATSPDGSRDAQAGGHPDVRTKVAFSTVPGPGYPEVVGNLRDSDVAPPAGLVGNPNAVSTCTMDELRSTGFFSLPECPTDSQVGMASVGFSLGFEGIVTMPVYSIDPPRGVPALFGTTIVGVPVFFEPELRGDDYGLTVRSRDTSLALALTSADVTLWGVPADPVHDAERVRYDPGSGQHVFGNHSGLPKEAFITAPMDCAAGQLTTTVRARSWQEPDNWSTAAFDTDFNGEPMQAEDCGLVPFAPLFSATPETSAPDSPTGLAVKLAIPQKGLIDPDGVASGELKKAVVTLPEGMTINPASAAGLGVCTDAQLGLGNTDPIGCPAAAKIGTVTAKTPLLDEAVSGGVYLRPQNSSDPESGEMFRLALVLENEERGVRVKLPGSVRADRNTGRLVTTFDNNPQLPLSMVELNLKGGPRAPLANPGTCGTKTVEAELSSWSGKTVTRTSSFEVDCLAALGGFAPSFSAGTVNPLGGAYSPFVTSISRPDADAEIAGVRLQLPEGLLANLNGNLGAQVGTVSALAGSGASPFALPGKVYLEGPYKGAPYSLKVVVPAKAGPFDLGTVTVRQKVEVDPVDTHVTAVSDPLPTIVAGVPARLQRLDVNVDKPQFTINPTSCDPKQIEGLITSIAAKAANVSDRFQAASCERLAFKPKLAISLSGKTNRSAHPALKATLTMPGGGANIAQAQVILPKTELLENAHIKTICTRVQFAADKCPAQSVYGHAKAWSPLLDKPIEGPVYLRSSNHELPDLVASLDGQIQIDLQGRIDSVNARIRNTFDLVPDAPVSKFVLTMQGGKKGLLANNTELCKAKPRADVSFSAQNGKSSDSRPLVKAQCAKGRKAKR